MNPETVQARAARLVQNEVHLCVSSIVSTLAHGPAFIPSEFTGREATDLRDLTFQAQELAMLIPDFEEAAREAGWEPDAALDGVWTHPGAKAGDFEPNHSCYGTAEALCQGEDIEPYDREVFEHWAVSDWLADKLIERGEKVDKDFAGWNVWARTTSGQGIASDSVIETIVREILA